MKKKLLCNQTPWPRKKKKNRISISLRLPMKLDIACNSNKETGNHLCKLWRLNNQ